MENEVEWMKSIAAGNANAFRSFYNAHANGIFNLALGFLKNQEEAEEAAMDVMLRIHQKAETFAGEASLKTWVYRITVNVCLDRQRHLSRKKQLVWLRQLFGTGDDMSNFPTNGLNAQQTLEQNEQSQRLNRAINKLPANQQLAIRLAYSEELSGKEIAFAMSISEKAVESLKQRAKKTLRKLLTDIGEAPRSITGKAASNNSQR